MKIQLKKPAGGTARIFKHIRSFYNGIEGSKLAIGLIAALVTTVLVGWRDAYLRRDDFLRPQRAALIEECSTFAEKIEEPLIFSTYGYIDYALDIESINEPRYARAPAIPPETIPADKEEAVKWKIRKAQEPLFKELPANNDRRKRILRLIQNYTLDPQIEIEWRLIDAALDLLPGEDRFVSELWMKREAINSGASSLMKWNKHNSVHGAEAQGKFIKHSSMAFRIYFYQQFIRDHMRELQRLILREQVGRNRIIPEWLRPQLERPIPAITYPGIIGTIFQEHEILRTAMKTSAWSK